MLEAIAGSTALAYYLDTFPHNTKDVLDLYAIDKATGFFVEFNRLDNGDVSSTFYVNFEEVEHKVYIKLEQNEFYDREKIEKDWQKHFPEIQPGDLVICSHPTYMLKSIHELFQAGFEKANWDHTLPEGTLLTVLGKVKIEDICFLRVLYRDKPMWAFGAVFKAEQFDGEDKVNDNHFI